MYCAWVLLCFLKCYCCCLVLAQSSLSPSHRSIMPNVNDHVSLSLASQSTCLRLWCCLFLLMFCYKLSHFCVSFLLFKSLYNKQLLCDWLPWYHWYITFFTLFWCTLNNVDILFTDIDFSCPHVAPNFTLLAPPMTITDLSFDLKTPRNLAGGSLRNSFSSMHIIGYL